MQAKIYNKTLPLFVLILGFTISGYAQDFPFTSLPGSTDWITSGDYDNDGDLDVFGINFRGSDRELDYYENISSSGMIQFDLNVIKMGGDAYGIPLSEDIDDDGDIDILYGSPSGQAIAMINRGDGVFDEMPLLNTTALLFESGDFDGDGIKDILAAGGPGESIVIFLKQENFNYTKHVVAPNINGFWDVELGDFDMDGDVDFVMGSEENSGPVLVLFENLGNGLDYNEIVVQDNSKGELFNFWKGDLDNDGDVDLGMVSNNQAGIWINQGDKTFEYQQIDNNGYLYINFYDFDGNGVLDVLLTGNNGMLWLQNSSTIPLGYNQREFSTFQGIYTSIGGDLDLDGDIDIVGSRLRAVIFQNNFPQSPPSSINELDPSQYSVFPNPTTDHLILQSKEEVQLRYKLHSMKGQLIRSGEAGYIPMQDLPAGLYNLEIIDVNTGDRRVEKLVKQ